ncbi:L-serine ammonia-lyase, iron-sulfur-dependent, subunit beta [Lutibacter sp. B2]|nr:L-serine ammonia-lyase, iron-sulfur-dependent, subunit beta [Lutibacter sp. B2]
MKNFSAFDIIGPRMIGPSSSHTAGAARLGRVAAKIGGDDIQNVVFLLHGSFAQTYRGHGTDRALVAGILGMEPNDENLRMSMEIASEKGLNFEFIKTDLGDEHPNTVKIIMTNKVGEKTEVTGSSIGGGSIKITQINGLVVEFTGEYPTLVVRQIDQPGVIAKVTKILNEFEINVAFMRVFRHSKGQDAFMIIETDTVVSKEVICKIKDSGKEIIHIYSIKSI